VRRREGAQLGSRRWTVKAVWMTVLSIVPLTIDLFWWLRR